MAKERYNTMFGPDGLLKDSYWDDKSESATRVRRGALNKPDFDYTEIGLLFPANNASEKVYLASQMKHQKKFGTPLKFHCHYIQNSADQPTFKISYRFYNNGAAPGSWTVLSTADGNKGIFTYASGDLLQIATFPEIPAPADENVSANLDVKFYRDDNDMSGDCLVKYIDFHYEINSFGSEAEYDKTE